ncbi:MAG: hypothetical protein HOA19_06990 [Candidatus Marinimicrobia bacterium]|nr:hypothetical protein [Candidatus Neomarinimicrobiota bacterium]
MVGLVISDTFLLCGVWDENNVSCILKNLVRVPLTERISTLLFDEAELNSVLASALHKAKESFPFERQNVVVGLPDEFVSHSNLDYENDLSREDYIDYINWLETKKEQPDSRSVSLFGQIYLPDESNIHVSRISNAFIRTIKLSIAEMGGVPFWMGAVSSLYLDGSGMSEAAMIQRDGNKYHFMKVQNNRFDMGTIAFSGGGTKVISTTDLNENITLAVLGLEESDLDDIPVFCPQKLGRQATKAWESSDLRISVPFDGVDTGDQSVDGIPEYEANILTQLITNCSIPFSTNFFDEPGITDFFFTKVIPIENGSETIEEAQPEIEISKKEDGNQSASKEMVLALLLIVGLFIGFNYLKIQEQYNNNFFGIRDTFFIERTPVSHPSKPRERFLNDQHSKLLKQSKLISSVLLKLLTQTDLNRYNSLTITKSFVSLEYLSGVNPNVENILGVDPTSFSVEAMGQDSTVFLWYYSFDLPEISSDRVSGELSKMDLMVQLDTLLTDYSLKYFEQIFTQNQIYGPMLIWVKNKADILQASAIISNVGDDILVRKFILFNEADRPKPRAGFYVSILED